MPNLQRIFSDVGNASFAPPFSLPDAGITQTDSLPGDTLKIEIGDDCGQQDQKLPLSTTISIQESKGTECHRTAHQTLQSTRQQSELITWWWGGPTAFLESRSALIQPAVGRSAPTSCPCLALQAC